MFYSTLLSVEVKRTRRLFRVRCSLFVWQRVGVFISDDVIEGYSFETQFPKQRF